MYSQSFAVYSFMVLWLQLWVCNNQSFNWWKCPEKHEQCVWAIHFTPHGYSVWPACWRSSRKNLNAKGHRLSSESFICFVAELCPPPVFPFWIIHSPSAVNKHWDSGVCLIITARWWWNIEDLESPEFCAARIHFHLPPTWLVAELITKVTDGWGNGTFFPLRDSRN